MVRILNSKFSQIRSLTVSQIFLHHNCFIYSFQIFHSSHDRNAFVWTYEPSESTWKPALVILRIERAAIDVKWSLDGLRFAVASGAKCVPVCTYEPANDWWVSKMIKKKFKSTVLCCAFHPKNGQLLATGSTDFKCRVFSTFAADVDGNAVNAGPFGNPLEFGEAYVELTSLGWVNAVAWSPSGSTLCYSGHDSTIHFATFSASGPVVRSIKLRDMPLNKLLFVTEKAVLGGGHDFNPLLFVNGSGEWSFNRRLDQRVEEVASASSAAGGVAAARALFQNKASRGQEKKADNDTLWTKHENSITGLVECTAPGQKYITKVSTSGLDGRLVVWDLPALELDMAALSV